MSWQQKARFAITAFVVAFIAIVAVALHQRKAPPRSVSAPVRVDKDCVLENTTGGHVESTREGKIVGSVKFGALCSYPDGRSKLGKGVEITSTKNGKPFTIVSREADVVQPGDEVKSAHFITDVKLTSDGTEVTTDDATYDQAQGTLKMPGAVAFRRGRMQGTGVGATYDLNRQVLWLLAKPHITVAPDEKGQEAIEATAEAAGMARADHYIKLTRSAHINGEGRLIDADDITILLTADDERVQTLQLRGNSRITGGGASSGPQNMSARDIDLTYGQDGRTLQHSHLVDNAVVQLPGENGSPGKRISARTIDITMSPDGKTVTNLNAMENVQFDLPADGDAPAKRIRSAALVATGAPGAGLQNATFSGNVDYRETRAARGALPAVDRQARAISLVIATKAGFGALEQADFHGNVHFTDGPDVTADSNRAIYHVDRDQIDLSPSLDPGPSAPRVSDGRVTVEARAIEFSLTSRKLKADTKVRSSMLPEHDRGQTGVKPGSDTGRQNASSAERSSAHVPTLLQQDQPVTVTSNRLEYDGAAGHALYSGNARLWQGPTKINGDTITVDDKTGNLEAHVNVHTEMMMDDVDPKTNVRKATLSTGEAEHFVYDDGKRLAIYTGKAHLIGSEGDLTAAKVELYLVKDANELERLEGYGANGEVIVKESGRTATGARVTYTEKDQTYHMTGTPVEAIETAPPDCKKSVGTMLTFQRAVESVSMTGNDLIRAIQSKIVCPGETR